MAQRNSCRPYANPRLYIMRRGNFQNLDSFMEVSTRTLKNILVPEPGSKLTGGLTYKDRRGTLIDWNLCYAAEETSSRRNFKTGTPLFMTPTLLGNDSIPQITLGHDMES